MSIWSCIVLNRHRSVGGSIQIHQGMWLKTLNRARLAAECIFRYLKKCFLEFMVMLPRAKHEWDLIVTTSKLIRKCATMSTGLGESCRVRCTMSRMNFALQRSCSDRLGEHFSCEWGRRSRLCVCPWVMECQTLVACGEERPLSWSWSFKATGENAGIQWQPLSLYQLQMCELRLVRGSKNQSFWSKSLCSPPTSYHRPRHLLLLPIALSATLLKFCPWEEE